MVYGGQNTSGTTIQITVEMTAKRTARMYNRLTD